MERVGRQWSHPADQRTRRCQQSQRSPSGDGLRLFAGRHGGQHRQGQPGRSHRRTEAESQLRPDRQPEPPRRWHLRAPGDPGHRPDPRRHVRPAHSDGHRHRDLRHRAAVRRRRRRSLVGAQSARPGQRACRIPVRARHLSGPPGRRSGDGHAVRLHTRTGAGRDREREGELQRGNSLPEGRGQRHVLRHAAGEDAADHAAVAGPGRGDRHVSHRGPTRRSGLTVGPDPHRNRLHQNRLQHAHTVSAAAQVQPRDVGDRSHQRHPRGRPGGTQPRTRPAARMDRSDAVRRDRPGPGHCRQDRCRHHESLRHPDGAPLRRPSTLTEPETAPSAADADATAPKQRPSSPKALATKGHPARDMAKSLRSSVRKALGQDGAKDKATDRPEAKRTSAKDTSSRKKSAA